MNVLTIGGKVMPRVQKLSASHEAVWSKNAGRGATGAMIGDIIARKTKLEIAFSPILGVPFVQEVISVSTALQHYAPQTDVAIELGGEDAKIIYFDRRQCGPAYERHLRRRYRFLYRPDGFSSSDRCRRTE